MMTAVVIPLGIAGVAGKSSGDAAAVIVGGLVGGDQTRGLGGVEPAFDGDLGVADRAVAGEIGAAEGHGLSLQRDFGAVFGFDLGGERDAGGGDGCRAGALVEAGNRKVVGAILGAAIAAFMATGATGRAAAASAVIIPAGAGTSATTASTIPAAALAL